MDKLLDTHTLLKLKQKRIDLNRPITSKEIESATKMFQHIRGLGHMASLRNLPDKEELVILLKLFKKTEMEGELPNLFYETSIILIPKPDKDPT